jgi:thiamine-phosphate pyrophosphorylase
MLAQGDRSVVVLPRLHLITDTRDDRDCLPVVEAALAAGLRCVQVRDKTHTDRWLYDLTRRIVDLAEPYAATVLVDDRADIAIAAGAHGVHVGADDLPVTDVRRIVGPEAIVGATARTPEAARLAAAVGATYVGVGPAYATTTKAGLPTPLGPERISVIAAAVDIPVVAIAGIGPREAAELRAVGAHGVAVVSAISDAADPKAATVELLAAVDGVAGAADGATADGSPD